MSREKKRFAQDIKAFVTLAGENAQKSVRKIALGIFANVVTSSPVDTGRFRGNWQVGLATKPEGLAPDVPTREPRGRDQEPHADGFGITEAITKANDKLSAAELGTTIFLSNNLPYAGPLEYGHSQQAPNGMVRTTFAALDQIVSEATK